jgi:putative N6-adenine-specific DNA methylase
MERLGQWFVRCISDSLLKRVREFHYTIKAMTKHQVRFKAKDNIKMLILTSIYRSNELFWYRKNFEEGKVTCRFQSAVWWAIGHSYGRILQNIGDTLEKLSWTNAWMITARSIEICRIKPSRKFKLLMLV